MSCDKSPGSLGKKAFISAHVWTNPLCLPYINQRVWDFGLQMLSTYLIRGHHAFLAAKMVWDHLRDCVPPPSNILRNFQHELIKRKVVDITPWVALYQYDFRRCIQTSRVKVS